MLEAEADEFGNGGLMGRLAQVHARLARCAGAFFIVAGLAAGHTIVEIVFSASGNGDDVVDGQRSRFAAAINACVLIPGQHILFREWYTVAVNAADDFDQHHDRRRPENSADPLNQAIRIFQNLGLAGIHKTLRFLPADLTKVAIVTVEQNAGRFHWTLPFFRHGARNDSKLAYTDAIRGSIPPYHDYVRPTLPTAVAAIETVYLFFQFCDSHHIH